MSAPSRPVVIGVDPGARATGVCARQGIQKLIWTTVERPGRINARLLTDAVYIGRVLDAIAAVREAVRWQVVRGAHGSYPVAPTIAVETVNPPSPRLGLSNPAGAMGTCVVLGAILARWPDAVRVPPGGHGSAPLRSYPPELVGAREKSGTGVLRHVRSAYDVAGAAAGVARLARAS